MAIQSVTQTADVDRSREIDPLIKELRAGLVSLPEAIRQLGYDPLTLIEEQSQFQQALDSLGLKLSSVPSHDADREPVSRADDVI
jgi:capsid protein